MLSELSLKFRNNDANSDYIRMMFVLEEKSVGCLLARDCQPLQIHRSSARCKRRNDLNLQRWKSGLQSCRNVTRCSLSQRNAADQGDYGSASHWCDGYNVLFSTGPNMLEQCLITLIPCSPPTNKENPKDSHPHGCPKQGPHG